MPTKVKRGLGLLVLAAIGYLVASAGGDMRESAYTTSQIVESAGLLLVAVGLIGGLGLLAWGLLRD
jgi:preprotein translocase subunit Sss1